MTAYLCIQISVEAKKPMHDVLLEREEENMGACSLPRYLLLPLRLKLSNQCCVIVTIWLVHSPICYLTFTGTIRCISASTAILRFPAFNKSTWNTALFIVACAHLWNMFHLFVFIIQAGAGDALPEEFHQCVIVGEIRLLYFDPIV